MIHRSEWGKKMKVDSQSNTKRDNLLQKDEIAGRFVVWSTYSSAECGSGGGVKKEKIRAVCLKQKGH